MSPLFCVNCKSVLYEPQTENGRCPTCGLTMQEMENMRHNEEFDLMLTALLYGRKPQ